MSENTTNDMPAWMTEPIGKETKTAELPDWLRQTPKDQADQLVMETIKEVYANRAQKVAEQPRIESEKRQQAIASRQKMVDTIGYDPAQVAQLYQDTILAMKGDLSDYEAWQKATPVVQHTFDVGSAEGDQVIKFGRSLDKLGTAIVANKVVEKLGGTGPSTPLIGPSVPLKK